jgi:signal transduction histidine kinase
LSVGPQKKWSSYTAMKREHNESAADEPTLRQGADEQNADDPGQMESLVRMVSVESLVRMVAGVAHELKNPLGILLMGIEYFAKKSETEDPTTTMVIADMREAVERSDAIVRAMVRYAASKPLVRVRENLNDAVEAAMRELEPELRGRSIAVSLELANRLPPLLLDRSRIEQAIVQVLNNALEAMPDSGSLCVRTFEDQTIEGNDKFGAVCLAIEDTGPGISTKFLSRVFLPFFTKHKSGKHAGLGLTIAQTIVQAHGGNISIRNRESGGALVSLTFALHPIPGVPSVSSVQ